jgi:hypothetical protein
LGRFDFRLTFELKGVGPFLRFASSGGEQVRMCRLDRKVHKKKYLVFLSP